MSLELLVNSLAVALGASFVATLAGAGAAIIAAALPRRVGTWVLLLSAVNLALPPFLIANAWLDLTATWRAMQSPETVRLLSLPLTALALASLWWPIAAFAVRADLTALQAAHLELEPALRGFPLFRYLLWPLFHRAALRAFVVIFVLSMANFTIPTLFQVRVFTEEFWIRFNTQFDLPGALAAAWPLLLFPALLLAVPMGRSVVWSRSALAIPPALLRSRLGLSFPIGGLLLLVWFGVAGLLPVADLVFAPRTWSELPGALAAGGNAWVNSCLTSGITALSVLCIGGLAASRKGRGRGPGPFWAAFFVPGVFLGVGCIYAFNRPPFFAFYHSLGLVIFALAFHYLPLAWAGMAVSRQTLDPTLYEIAQLAGASRWQIFRWVEWPQLRGAIAAYGLAVFLLALWDVETVVLIQPPGGETLSLRVFNLLHYGHAAQVNALCLVLLGTAALVAIPLLWLSRSVLPLPRTRPLAPSAFTLLALIGIAPWLTGCHDGAEPVAANLDSRLFSRVEVIGSRGVAPGQFNKPRSLVCDRDDNLYVSDMTGRIQKFSPSGQYLLQWQFQQTDLGKPKGMGLDPAGNILVVEPHYQRVNHFTTNGQWFAQWGIKGTNAAEFILPRSIGVNSHGEYFLSEYTVVDRVQRFSLDFPKKGDKANPTASPSPGIAHPAFHLLSLWGAPGLAPGQFNRAEGIGIATNDWVYIADSCNHRIQVFTPDGRFIRTYGRAGSAPGELSYPYDIKIDTAGNQFVCEFGNSRVSVFDANDRLIEVIGQARPGTEPGRFANPWSLTLDSHGNLYVADSQNHRVQKFIRRTAPNLAAVAPGSPAAIPLSSPPQASPPKS
jgi:ABC-type Fe3+ transport system permease subunit/DNA-binding beta-propeller fold protein YncE